MASDRVHPVSDENPVRKTKLVGAVVALGIVAGSVVGVPAATAAPTDLSWGPCPAVHGAKDARCATVAVPLDHARPAGPKISVLISRIPARDQSRKRGILFGNPGGPGGDSIGMWSNLRPPESVRDEWDLVAVQPRGLPGATPVRCDPIDPTDPAVFTAMGKVNRDRCERGTPGYTRTLTTENTARDLDVVRRALGAPRISLYGISYGTLLMATYATLYPQHTDRLVLDSGVDPAWMWNSVLAEQTPGYKARVNAMMTWIAQHDNIYHLGRTPLQVYRNWSAKVTREAGVPPSLAAPPAQVGDVPPGLRAFAAAYLAGTDLTADARARFENFVATVFVKPGSVQATSSLLLLTRIAAPSRNMWPAVALRTAGRAPQPKKPSKADLVAQQTAVDMQQLILCNENQVAARPDQIPASVFANFVVGDIFESPGLLYRSGMACAGAPAVSRPVGIADRGLAVRPLQIQSLGDPQTPYRGSMAMRAAMRSHLITVGGGDHGQLGRRNRPLDAAIGDYLRSGHTGVTAVPQAPIIASLTTAPQLGIGLN